jgi:predicted GIY-YIG superfamily endonuclease
MLKIKEAMRSEKMAPKLRRKWKKEFLRSLTVHFILQ